MGDLLYPKNSSVISDPRTDIFVRLKLPSENLCLKVGGEVAINEGKVCEGWHVFEKYSSDGFLYVGVRKKRESIKNGHIMVQGYSESDAVVGKSFFIDRAIKEDIDDRVRAMFDWTIGSDSNVFGIEGSTINVSGKKIRTLESMKEGFVFSQKNGDLAVFPEKNCVINSDGDVCMIPPLFSEMDFYVHQINDREWFIVFYSQRRLFICEFRGSKNTNIYEWFSSKKIDSVFLNEDVLVACTEEKICWTFFSEINSIERICNPIESQWNDVPFDISEDRWNFDIGDTIFVCWNENSAVVFKQSFEEAITWFASDVGGERIESLKVIDDYCIVNSFQDMTLIIKPFNPNIKKINKIDFCMEQ